MQSSTGPGRPRIRVSREKMQTRGWQSRLFEASNWPQHYAEKRRKLQYAQLSAFPHTLGRQPPTVYSVVGSSGDRKRALSCHWLFSGSSPRGAIGASITEQQKG